MRRILPPLVLLVACGIAAAQATLTTLEAAALGYRLGYPSGWVVVRVGGDAYLSIQPPEGSVERGRAAIELVVDDELADTTLDDALDDALDDLRDQLMPDLTVASRSLGSVSGVPAVVVRLTGTAEGTPVAYRILALIDGGRGYALFLESVADQVAAYEALFDQVQASFALTQARSPLAPLAPIVPITPIAPTSLPSTTAEPTSPTTLAPDYVGSFADAQLRLTLSQPAASGSYTGTIVHGDRSYPLSARPTPDGLSGAFESDGQSFPFTATLAGDQLTFATGGATYLLERVWTAADAPVNPLGAPDTAIAGVSGEAPGATVEVVAGTTTSAFIGALEPNGRARGRLDGAPEAFAYHTYVVELPPGTVRWVVELDADADLDLALKHGSEIRSYADRDRGGDWDHRDIATRNPTVVVVERPAAGRWYVDVVNALGAPRHGTYRLTVATTVEP